MGVRARADSPSYSVVDVSRILHAEPMVPIGVAPAAQQKCTKRKRDAARKPEAPKPRQPYQPKLKHGAPLFANNIHVWL